MHARLEEDGELYLRFRAQTAEDGDGNVGKTIKPIIEDKKRCTWICEIKLTFVPSWSQMRLQLLHFHAVFKTWPTFQELTSIVSFRRRRWSQRNFSENRNIHGNQSKDVLKERRRLLGRNNVLASRRWRCRPRNGNCSQSSVTQTQVKSV